MFAHKDICLLNASITFFLLEEEYGNLTEFITEVARQVSKEAVRDYVETLRFWPKYYVSYGMDVLTFETSFKIRITKFDAIRIRAMKVLESTMNQN